MISYRDCIVFLLAKAHQRAQAVFKEHLQAHGLTPVQCLLLEVLWQEDQGLAVGEIGRRLTLDAATLAGVLDRLVAAGWLRREADPEDGRVARIYLTERAQLATDDLQAAIETTNQELLEEFSLEEMVLLKRLLRDFRD